MAGSEEGSSDGVKTARFDRERMDGEDGSVRVVGEVVWSHALVGSEMERHE